MIYKMYSIKDELAGYHAPVPIEEEAQAVRWFKNYMTENVNMKNNPEDFNLYYMGTFDTESGTYIQIANEIQRVAKGVDYV